MNCRKKPVAKLKTEGMKKIHQRDRVASGKLRLYPQTINLDHRIHSMKVAWSPENRPSDSYQTPEDSSSPPALSITYMSSQES